MKKGRRGRFNFATLLKYFMPNEKYNDYLRKQGVTIGENCIILRNVEFGGEPYLVTIGNNVRITSRVSFFTHDGGLWTLRKMGLIPQGDCFGKISVGDNTNIGWGAMILPGVSIGKNCVIGCGAVVTHDIPDGTVAAGVPARPIETIEEYYEKVKDKCVGTAGMTPEEKREYLLENMK